MEQSGVCGDDKEDEEDSDNLLKFPKSVSKIRESRERKKSKRRTIALDVDNNKQKSSFEKQPNVLEKKTVNKLNNILDSMEKRQSQQIQMMDKFMKTCK